MLARKASAPVREIVYRTKGHMGGPITRLVSPSDLGQVIKPFVFLDLFQFEPGPRMPMDQFWHPHSGIATATVILDGGVRFAETTGRTGTIPRGGVEWMRAGNGVWHTGEAARGHVKGFQLWVALPPELENGPFASQYVMPEEVPSDERVRLILGSYGKLKSSIEAPPMTYLSITLRDGGRWSYEPPQGHDVVWVAVADGHLRAPSSISAGEIAVFEQSNESIDFIADGPTRFVLGSAAKHPHELALGSYSVHTSEAALRRGELEIRRIGRELREKAAAYPAAETKSATWGIPP
jgi:redox-sensitive bicupin YhaK (pirin superfamily)